MSYNYSNPYQSTSNTPSRPFNAPSSSAAVTSQARQVLFSGLPIDISEKDLRDLLLQEPTRLSPVTTSVKCFSGPDGRFCGIALIYVANAAEAEKIRVHYSGQQIDGTYTMSVQHILPASQSITNNTPSIPSTSSAPAPASRSAQPSKTPTKVPKAKPNGPAAPKGDEKPAGLQLLARLSKPAQPKEKQLALLEKQKANLAKSGAGGALLSRLQGSPNSHASAKTKGRVQKLSTGNAKVGRAKGKAGKDAMDVDKAVATKPKPKVKTQAELDEEMRAYERARRFA